MAKKRGRPPKKDYGNQKIFDSENQVQNDAENINENENEIETDSDIVTAEENVIAHENNANETFNKSPKNFDPLQQEIETEGKEYTQAKVNIPKEGIPKEIEEPEIPDVFLDVIEKEDDAGSGGLNKIDDIDYTEIKPPKKPKITHEDLDVSDLSEKEKKKYARDLAVTVVEAYCFVNERGLYWVMSMEDDRIKSKSVNGKFNLDILSVQLPLNAEGTKFETIINIVHDYNSTLKEACTPDGEFKEELTEALTSYFISRNVGLTPLQRILFLVVKDMGLRISVCITKRMELNNIFLIASEYLKKQVSPPEEKNAVSEKPDTSVAGGIEIKEPEEVENE